MQARNTTKGAKDKFQGWPNNRSPLMQARDDAQQLAQGFGQTEVQ